jgi:SnoaL-like protein
VIGERSSGRSLVRLVASVPAATAPDVLRARIAAYYDSYATQDLTGREALFAATCRFEDPAGHVVADDRASLHEFFVTGIPAHWSITFALERIAVVGDEALATVTLSLQVADRTPTAVLVNTHFAFDDRGLIASARTFFDAEAMTDDPV